MLKSLFLNTKNMIDIPKFRLILSKNTWHTGTEDTTAASELQGPWCDPKLYWSLCGVLHVKVCMGVSSHLHMPVDGLTEINCPCVNVCVSRCMLPCPGRAGIPSRVYSSLMPSVPGIDSSSTMTLTMIKWLLSE